MHAYRVKRQTITEKEQLAQEMEEEALKREQERETRHKAAHQMVANLIKREIEGRQSEKKSSVVTLADSAIEYLAPQSESNTFEDVDDTDGLDPKSELEAWKLRELKRIQRDKEEQMK